MRTIREFVAVQNRSSLHVKVVEPDIGERGTIGVLPETKIALASITSVHRAIARQVHPEVVAVGKS